VTSIAQLLSPADRRRLLERLADLEATGRLVAERGQQRPAPEPVPLHQAATNPTRRETE
jgi:hypothetical protein